MAVAYTKTTAALKSELNSLVQGVKHIMYAVKSAKRLVSKGLLDTDYNPGLIYANAQDVLDIATTHKTTLSNLISAAAGNRYRFTWKTSELLASWDIDVDNGSSKGEIQAVFFGANTVSWTSEVTAGDFIEISGSVNENDGIYVVDAVVDTTTIRFTTVIAGTDNTSDTSSVLSKLKSTY